MKKEDLIKKLEGLDESLLNMLVENAESQKAKLEYKYLSDLEKRKEKIGNIFSNLMNICSDDLKKSYENFIENLDNEIINQEKKVPKEYLKNREQVKANISMGKRNSVK